MARAGKLNLRAFQQELATRLAAKTTAQVEQSRLGLACAGSQWLIRLADAGEVSLSTLRRSTTRSGIGYLAFAQSVPHIDFTPSGP